MFSASKTGAGASGYPIVNSLRFQSASATYLARTFGSAASGTTATFSFWIKRGAFSGVLQEVFGWSNGVNTSFSIEFQTNDQLSFYSYSSGMVALLTTSQVFRDPSAWYHIVCVIDTTNATSTNRIKMYVNGSQVTAFATTIYPAQNTVLNLATTGHSWGIGIQAGTGAYFFDGYMAEWNFIDGQALTPSSFGETNATTGQWIAKKYNGTYGTNGFFLKFNNGTSTTTLGSDSSGNGNNWTLNNFTRSAGVSDCWMNDVPSGNGSQAGGTQPNSNYAVLNPLLFNIGLTTYSAANLSASLGNASNWRSALSTIFVRSGLWYAEMVVSSNANNFFGVALSNSTFWNAGAVSIVGWTTDSWSYSSTGNKYTNATATALGSAMSAGDIIGIALDLDNGAIYFSANGVFLGGAVPTSGAAKTNAAYSLTTGLEYVFAISGVGGTTASVNFGQRSFAYTPPSGFKALCTANLPASTIVKGNEYMDATLYTGNSSIQNVVNAAGFSPDLVWIKNRSGATDHILNDTVRGAGNYLISNLTNAETTNTIIFSAFNSNGFQVNNAAQTNASGSNYVGWQWDAGSSTVTNTSGSSSSQVRANPTAGVSVVTYTGTGANATVGHGLGVAPKMLIVKSRSTADTWRVYHASLGNTKYINLNDTSAAGTASTVWNNTSPTSSVFTVGTESSVNGNGRTQVAYCFAEIAGFSKFGSYTGNGSTDGTFVYTGFRPKYVMIKRTDTTGNWDIQDGARSPYNQVGDYLLANAADVEVGGSVLALDFLSNGFKLRVSQANINASGGTYIYACFAENPFAQANAR